MGHFTIHVNGERVGCVLALQTGRLSVCFNRRFPQYQNAEGTPEQVKFTLRRMIPGAKYEPLSLPKLDAWMQELDQTVLPRRAHTDTEQDGWANL